MKFKRTMPLFIVIALAISIFVICPNIEKTNVLAYPPATTPGIDDWGNATTDLVYNIDTAVTPRINTTGMTNLTYYLYKPAYNCSPTGYRLATGLQWFEQVLRTDTSTPATLTVTIPGNIQQLSGPIILDRAGMWVFSQNDLPSTGLDGTDITTIESFFWVNTSQDLDINTIADFNFGSNNTKTISVTQDGGIPDAPVNIDLIAPDSTTVFHQYEADGIYSFGTYGNITMAGNYTIRAYADLDEYSSEAYLYNDEGIGNGYNDNYGIGFSPIATGDGWDYDICGPWDPPEIDASELIFRVTPGELLTSVNNDSQIMYWNYSGEVNISIKDTSNEPISAADYTVSIYNQFDVDVSRYFTYSAGDQTETADITKYDGYCIINSTGWGVNQSDWEIYGSNGTWYANIYVDLNGDRTEGNKQWTEEWNSTVEWTVSPASLINNPPYKPSNPNPNDKASNININTDLSWDGGDPDVNDTVTYDIYFSNTTPPLMVEANHSLTVYNPGILSFNTTYYWKIVAWDNHGDTNIGDIWFFTTEKNKPPLKPTIKGPISLKTGREYEYTFVTTDPEGDNVFYRIDWGDGNITEWLGPNISGVEIKLKHTWYNEGTYRINVEAKDSNNAISEIGTLRLTIPSTQPDPVIPIITATGIGGGTITTTLTIRRITRKKWEKKSKKKKPSKTCQVPGQIYPHKELELKIALPKLVHFTFKIADPVSGEKIKEKKVKGEIVDGINKIVSAHRRGEKVKTLQTQIKTLANMLIKQIKIWLPSESISINFSIIGHFIGSEIKCKFVLYRCEPKGPVNVWKKTNKEWESTIKDEHDKELAIYHNFNPTELKMQKKMLTLLIKALERLIEKVDTL
jgi:hypothetical protein